MENTRYAKEVATAAVAQMCENAIVCDVIAGLVDEDLNDDPILTERPPPIVNQKWGHVAEIESYPNMHVEYAHLTPGTTTSDAEASFAPLGMHWKNFSVSHWQEAFGPVTAHYLDSGAHGHSDAPTGVDLPAIMPQALPPLEGRTGLQQVAKHRARQCTACCEALEVDSRPPEGGGESDGGRQQDQTQPRRRRGASAAPQGPASKRSAKASTLPTADDMSSSSPPKTFKRRAREDVEDAGTPESKRTKIEDRAQLYYTNFKRIPRRARQRRERRRYDRGAAERGGLPHTDSWRT
ncbi:hypothetical protein BDK51DRAFT_44814 [Blyttiomyces helicus]|uniref:Uncharacterized protein n=1 Tax=Blyttiomyces helicus TaxID=388810 RepID=A0A4P9WQU8_9FUNG|nr:hypothetical protein BDK51DRAFT_44814 [Blyttiomyces helicus]|eukprot:RKO93600.1 hypothetical protein BDK51DRAFT_44814 [Blyttiomyces helicus]